MLLTINAPAPRNALPASELPLNLNKSSTPEKFLKIG